MLGFFKKKESKAKYWVGQDVMDSQDMSVGQVTAVHDRYVEITESGGSNKTLFVPLDFISPIPRGEGIALIVAKAQFSVKSWDKPPQ